MKQQQGTKTIRLEDLISQLPKEERTYIDSNIEFSDFLYELIKERKNQKLTQEDISKKTGIPRTTITKIESGNRNTTIRKILLYASALQKVLKLELINMSFVETASVDARFDDCCISYTNVNDIGIIVNTNNKFVPSKYENEGSIPAILFDSKIKWNISGV